ncbi:unnamed protein product [Mycena citricolor]|uniref:Protein-tyrosine-phosphatase n=1 Tax=Mycena citricolor TaxID=2018698 RepID=A0AAD2HYN8_9AGAR|nr:unnamed protein product [Mycena citricolor]
MDVGAGYSLPTAVISLIRSPPRRHKPRSHHHPYLRSTSDDPQNCKVCPSSERMPADGNDMTPRQRLRTAGPARPSLRPLTNSLRRSDILPPLSIELNSTNASQTPIFSPSPLTAISTISTASFFSARSDLDDDLDSEFPSLNPTSPDEETAPDAAIRSPVAHCLSPYTSAHPSLSALTPHLAVGDLAFAENPALLLSAGITHVISVFGGRVHIPTEVIPPANHLHVSLEDTPFAELVGAMRPVVDWVTQILLQGGVLPHTESAGAAVPVRILIHCAHGISRSPAVGAALLVALPLIESVGPQPMGDSSARTTPDIEEQDQFQRPIRQLLARAGSSPDNGQQSRPPRRNVPRTMSAPNALAYVEACRPSANVNWGFRAQLTEWEMLCRDKG